MFHCEYVLTLQRRWMPQGGGRQPSWFHLMNSNSNNNNPSSGEMGPPFWNRCCCCLNVSWCQHHQPNGILLHCIGVEADILIPDKNNIFCMPEEGEAVWKMCVFGISVHWRFNILVLTLCLNGKHRCSFTWRHRPADTNKTTIRQRYWSQQLFSTQ